MHFEQIIEQIKEFEKLGDKQTSSQISYIVLARLHDISAEQLRSIPQNLIDNFLSYIPDHCDSLSTQNQEDYIRWAKDVFESYRNNRDILRSLSHKIDGKKSDIDHKSIRKQTEEYQYITNEEAAKINKNLLENRSRLAEFEMPNRGTGIVDQYIQIINRAAQDYYRKQGRIWQLALKHSDIKIDIKSNQYEFIKAYAALVNLAKDFFDKGFYLLGRECLAIKSYYDYGTYLSIADYPLDKLLEHLVKLNKDELLKRKNGKDIKPKWRSYKDELYETRRQAAEKIIEIESLSGVTRILRMQALQTDFKKHYLNITSSIFTTITSILGEPPSGICIIAFGSISRGDVNGDSDIEPGFILKEGLSEADKKKAIQYIQNFRQLWKFEMIAIGESTRAGFHLDDGSGKDLFNSYEEYANHVITNIGANGECESDNTKLRPLFIFGDKSIYDKAAELIYKKLHNEAVGKDAKLRTLKKIAEAVENPDILDSGVAPDKKLEPKKKYTQLLVWAITQYAINNGLSIDHSVHPFDIINWLSQKQFFTEDFINLCRIKLCWLYEHRMKQSLATFGFKSTLQLTPDEEQKEIAIIDKELLKPFGLLLNKNRQDNRSDIGKKN